MKKWLARMFLTLAGAIAVPVAAQDGPDERAFAERYLPYARELLPGATITSEPGEPLQINVSIAGEDGPQVINLHRVFARCQTLSRSECDSEVALFIAVLTREADAPRAENLRIIVRDVQYWGAMLEVMAKSESLPIYRQVGEDLYAMLALDAPDRISVIGGNTLDEMELDRDTAWQQAERQTRALFGDFPDPQQLARQPILYEGPEYVSSMMFDLAGWEAVAKDAGSDFVVGVPTDQFVLAAIIPEGEFLEEVKALNANECAAAPRCISPNLYRFRDGMWVIAD